MVNIAAAEVRNRITPIPTPLVVRATGSVAAGVSVAVLVSQAPVGVAALIALTCVAVALAVTFVHPYRNTMRAFAVEKNIDRRPSISMLLPLMLWWLLLMLAPLATWPGWAAAMVFAVISASAWILFPHVDGSRRLAYAEG